MSKDETFDSARSQQLKDKGMAQAASNRRFWLDLARDIAVQLGQQRRYVTADDVGRLLKAAYDIESLGPAAGSLFKTSDWRWTGRFRKSARVSNHSRMLRVWEYIGDDDG